MYKRFEKKCRVCGDNALSFNFNGLCCETCKIFFRRNAHNSQKLRCYHKGNCQITVMTRKSCRLCRLNKCFQIGMQKDRIKKSKSNDSSTSALKNCETSVLKPYESYCLEIIKKASLIFPDLSPQMKNRQILGYASNLVQMFNTQECQIQNMIKFFNTIEGYQCLKLDDQLVVFKSAFPEIMLLHSVFYFNFEKNACLVQTNQHSAIYIKLDGLYFGENSQTSIRLHRLLAFNVKKELKYDLVLRELVSVLLMFTPKKNISCPEFIRHQYFTYSHLLARYLEYKYPDSDKANEKYCQIQQIVHDIGAFQHKLNAVVSRNLDYNQVSGVLSEIYLPIQKSQMSHIDSIKEIFNTSL